MIRTRLPNDTIRLQTTITTVNAWKTTGAWGVCKHRPREEPPIRHPHTETTLDIRWRFDCTTLTSPSARDGGKVGLSPGSVPW